MFLWFNELREGKNFLRNFYFGIEFYSVLASKTKNINVNQFLFSKKTQRLEQKHCNNNNKTKTKMKLEYISQNHVISLIIRSF